MSSVSYWRTPCTCGFQAQTAEEWQRHGILYQGCGKGSSPFQRQRGKRKPNNKAEPQASLSKTDGSSGSSPTNNDQ